MRVPQKVPEKMALPFNFSVVEIFVLLEMYSVFYCVECRESVAPCFNLIALILLNR